MRARARSDARAAQASRRCRSTSSARRVSVVVDDADGRTPHHQGRLRVGPRGVQRPGRGQRSTTAAKAQASAQYEGGRPRASRAGGGHARDSSHASLRHATTSASMTLRSASSRSSISPKDGVRDGRAGSRALGVAVKLITGDSASSRSHVARLVGIRDRSRAHRRASSMSCTTRRCGARPNETDLFAEVDPNQKERHHPRAEEDADTSWASSATASTTRRPCTPPTRACRSIGGRRRARGRRLRAARARPRRDPPRRRGGADGPSPTRSSTS